MEPDHPFREWRRRNKVSAAQVYAQIGILPSHLSDLERGKKGVSLSTAIKIERLTNGEVPPSALLPEAAQ